MHPEESPVARITDHLRERFGAAPPLALVLGSGLGPVLERIAGADEATATSLGLPESTVPGHSGRVVCGQLGGVGVVAMAGRVHLYEGYPAAVVVRGIRALHRWGVKRLLLTCSAGSMRTDVGPGSLVLIKDHINMQHTNPLIGRAWGPHRFPDLTNVYDPAMRAALHQAAEGAGVELHEGVYAAMSGPAYETPAEVRMVAQAGAHLVGMSTVPEVLAAAEVGLRVAAIAVVSNLAAGYSNSPLTHDEVTGAAGIAARGLASVLAGAATRLVEDE